MSETREEYDHESLGQLLEQDWIGSSDVDALDVSDGAVLGWLTRDGLSTGAPYSRAGSRRVRDEQCLCSPSRRPLGSALQSGRDDAVAGGSVHGRGALVRWINKFHQSDRRDSTGDRNGSVAWPPPGHTYITANLKDLGVTALGDLSAGIGLTVPFGSLTRWPNDGPFRTATTFSTLPLLDIKPTLAYKVTENLSLGLGADIYTFSGLFGEGHVEKQSIPARRGDN